MCQECVRTPIKIKRKPVTAISEAGLKMGLWYPMPRPEEDEPPRWKTKSNQRILWCPWCMDWAIFNKTAGGLRWNCTGVCGWGNTDEFHTKTQNRLWGE
ncbi:gp21.4 [Bacillus phage SPO1]|uniref:Gp21.4 n=2 Tax=Okubovirus TaxID=1857845 RepID=B6V2S3_BPSP1|nr:gp21.4 [Bacillus phage SPO1]YP_008770046.1 hypothetical protein CampHawk_112 [Bacillus phage CampHawk]ACI91015.1 gp21.4 [Bacillus phage SPO1]AGY46990.1 hypothetical protein CampHawk_112 [Bacillus phage CampHawk]UNY49062.1 hypothetical protein sp82g_125 [Bacillus phage SP82G]